MTRSFGFSGFWQDTHARYELVSFRELIWPLFLA
jgi:hypothetical protein